jgi:hypothetical protein
MTAAVGADDGGGQAIRFAYDAADRVVETGIGPYGTFVEETASAVASMVGRAGLRLISPAFAHPESQRLCYAARSFMPEMPNCLAQWAQQKVLSPASTPWPMIRQPQWAQRGAMPWMAHSKLSKVMLRVPWVMTIVLS